MNLHASKKAVLSGIEALSGTLFEDDIDAELKATALMTEDELVSLAEANDNHASPVRDLMSDNGFDFEPFTPSGY